MKTQVIVVAALLILVALSSNFDMVAEAQELGPGDCYDGCATGCVQRDAKKTSKCERKCAKRCGRGGKRAREIGA
ncbi:hypothetical protein AALP_AA1G269100 [Arabis alpina]|uniref:Uncharacterized protein n=1 Tax=Arabis alpina TaxID=50452 RepID=A0A087HQY1_ARAAL|nr:hypothetical protein AALP_AA1G269100 [Arabis alpina]